MNGKRDEQTKRRIHTCTQMETVCAACTHESILNIIKCEFSSVESKRAALLRSQNEWNVGRFVVYVLVITHMRARGNNRTDAWMHLHVTFFPCSCCSKFHFIFHLEVYNHFCYCLFTTYDKYFLIKLCTTTVRAATEKKIQSFQQNIWKWWHIERI